VGIHATGRRISPNRRKKLKDGAFPFEESRRDWFRTKDSLQLHIRFRQEPHPMTNEELLTRIETLLDDRFGVVNRQFEIIDGKFKTVDERFDELSCQFNGLTGRFDQLSGRFDELSGRFDELSGRFDELRAEVISTRDILEARIASVEHRLDRLENRVEAVRVELKQEIRDTRDHLEAEIGRSFSAIIETHRDVKLTRRRVREIEQETLTRIEQLEQRVERLEAEFPPQS
jgi:chromosome segregation ATPase